MAEELKQISVSAGPETEELLNYVFKNLSDEIVDQIRLERITPESNGVARELVTTAAVLSFSSAIAVPIINLIGKWMEQKRQQRAVELIYRSAKENPKVTHMLVELEKKRAELAVKPGNIVSRLLKEK